MQLQSMILSNATGRLGFVARERASPPLACGRRLLEHEAEDACEHRCNAPHGIPRRNKWVLDKGNGASSLPAQLFQIVCRPAAVARRDG